MTTLSYNYGRPVQKYVEPTLAEAINLFDKLRRSGKVFRVDFVKRGDNTRRTMVCRFGVKKYTKGGKKAYDPGDKGLFTVWEFGNGYRSITIDNLILLKVGGVVYQFNQSLTHPPIPAPSLDMGSVSRTIPAYTNPMYTEMGA